MTTQAFFSRPRSLVLFRWKLAFFFRCPDRRTDFRVLCQTVCLSPTCQDRLIEVGGFSFLVLLAFRRTLPGTGIPSRHRELRAFDRRHMPPTKRATWEDIEQVDSKLKSDHRFDWLAGTHTAPRVFSDILTANGSFSVVFCPPARTARPRVAPLPRADIHAHPRAPRSLEADCRFGGEGCEVRSTSPANRARLRFDVDPTVSVPLTSRTRSTRDLSVSYTHLRAHET